MNIKDKEDDDELLNLQNRKIFFHYKKYQTQMF